jgi:hypothetical protein
MICRCIEEISMLRHEIATLSPKAHAYDQITTVLGLLPKPSQGYGEDIIWRLKKQLEELKPEIAED